MIIRMIFAVASVWLSAGLGVWVYRLGVQAGEGNKNGKRLFDAKIFTGKPAKPAEDRQTEVLKAIEEYGERLK